MKEKSKKILSSFIAAMVLSSCSIQQTEAAYENFAPVIKNETIAPPATVKTIPTTTVVTEQSATTTTTAITTTTTAVITTTTTATTEAQPVFIQADTERFSQRMAEIYSDYGITGMSVAVFSDGKIIHTENLGLADVKNEIPCEDNTLYRIASTSKLVSTMVLMKLYDEGKLSLDTVLSEATGIEYNSPLCEGRVELWHILTHTAGIFDTWRFENESNMKYDINRLMPNSLSGCEPGTTFNYSNFGSGSIGAVIERITGEYFHDYAERVFFEPIGMDAGYAIDLIDSRENAANLYDFDGEILKVKEWGRDSEYYESFGLGNSYYSAQCELIITASDLARLGIALSGDGTVDGKAVLSAEAVNAINKNYFSAENFDMGLNVRIYDDLIDGRVMYGHPGNALGCITGLYYDPSDGTGVAFLTNHCLPYTDRNGFYSALKEAVTEAYQCFFRYEE